MPRLQNNPHVKQISGFILELTAKLFFNFPYKLFQFPNKGLSNNEFSNENSEERNQRFSIEIKEFKKFVEIVKGNKVKDPKTKAPKKVLSETNRATSILRDMLSQGFDFIYKNHSITLTDYVVKPPSLHFIGQEDPVVYGLEFNHFYDPVIVVQPKGH